MEPIRIDIPNATEPAPPADVVDATARLFIAAVREAGLDPRKAGGHPLMAAMLQMRVYA